LKKELKKQIKEDEFLSTLERAWRWFEGNRRTAQAATAALVAAALLVGGVSFYRARREQRASAAFDAAMAIYETPLASEQQGPAPLGRAPFATSQDKFTKATAAFDGVERAYPDHVLGRRARYYAALSRLELGETAPAEKALKSLADTQPASSLEGALARLALADLQRRSGALDQAVESYRALADDPGLGLPRDHVLMSLAGALESAQRTTEAVASYRRLFEQFPESVYAPEAQRRAAYLKPDARG
jgi:tetratricopeptide (TPR) repeat protein